jgi:hypothetical protein
MMMTKMVIEMLVQYRHLTWLIDQEDLIKCTEIFVIQIHHILCSEKLF